MSAASNPMGPPAHGSRLWRRDEAQRLLASLDGMTNGHIGNALGKKHVLISRWRAGMSVPSAEQLERLRNLVEKEMRDADLE